jgi:hypothetical protein
MAEKEKWVIKRGPVPKEVRVRNPKKKQKFDGEFVNDIKPKHRPYKRSHDRYEDDEDDS